MEYEFRIKRVMLLKRAKSEEAAGTFLGLFRFIFHTDTAYCLETCLDRHLQCVRGGLDISDTKN